MENMATLLYILFWVAIAIILIYLIVRRIEIKKIENFEDRDN